MTADVTKPPHLLHALTTYELPRYRRELEHAIAFFDTKDPIPLARHRLQAKLDEMLAEQKRRTQIAQASGRAAPGL